MPKAKVGFQKRQPLFSGIRRQDINKLSEVDLVNTPRPTGTESESSRTKPKKKSSSKKKLGKLLHDYRQYEKQCNPKDMNDIVNLLSLESLLAQIAVCNQCQGKLNISTRNRIGLFMNMSIICNDLVFTVSNSLQSKHKEVNVRLA